MTYALLTQKKIMTAFTACALLAAPLFGASAGDEKSEDRQLASFHSIEVKGAVELKIQMSSKQKVSVSVDEMDLSDIKTVIKGGVLYIDTLKEKSFWGGKSQHGHVTLSLSMTDFKNINVKGAVDGTIEGVDSKNVGIEVSGAVDLDISGSCDKLTVSVRGAGDLDAEKLKCKDVDISISGAGDADVYASKSIKAVVSGVGNVTVKGDPANISKNVRGFGTIKIKK